MRTITKDQTAHTFAELSDSAKDHARFALDLFNDEYVLEDFTTIAGLMGFYDVTPRYSGFSSQGDGASFTGSYRYNKGAAAAISEYAPLDKELQRIAQGLQTLQARHFYQLRAVLTLGYGSNMYCHENTIDFDITRNGAWVECDDFIELARDLMRWLYKTLEKEYEYSYSDECVKDACDANDYEFDQSGNLV